MSIFKKILTGVMVSATLVFFAFGPAVPQISRPNQAKAQVDFGSISSGFVSGLSTCVAQDVLGGISGVLSGLLGTLSGISEVPVRDREVRQDVETQVQKEGCLDAILYQTAKNTLNNLLQDTHAWVESGFTRFGQTGNRGYIYDIDGFLAGISDQTYNRFIQQAGESGALNPLARVCEEFADNVLLSVSNQYFASQNSPSGVAAPGISSIGETNCEDLERAVGGDVGEFISGDFSQGGWSGFYQTLESRNASPVGAFLTQDQKLSERVQQARSEDFARLQRESGWLSQVACPEGVLNGSTGLCEDGDQTYEPVIKTPGSVVNETVSNIVSSDFRRIELADEANEVVGALVDQLVSKITGTSEGSGFFENREAIEASNPLGNADNPPENDDTNGSGSSDNGNSNDDGDSGDDGDGVTPPTPPTEANLISSFTVTPISDQDLVQLSWQTQAANSCRLQSTPMGAIADPAVGTQGTITASTTVEYSRGVEDGGSFSVDIENFTLSCFGDNNSFDSVTQPVSGTEVGSGS